MSRSTPSWRQDGRLGDKLGPRLARLMTDSAVRARVALAPHEARVRQAATQAVIDRMGHEAADLLRPILAHALADDSRQLHPHMTAWLEQATSGSDQWKAVLGSLQAGGTSAFGSALSNLLFPITGEINKLDPTLPVDFATGAQAVAAGLASYGLGVDNAAVWGYRADAFHYQYLLSQAPPDAGTLAQLVNRGLIGEGQMSYWLQRAAVPEQLHGPIIGLRRQLLSPADAALAVLRGVISKDTGAIAASHSGVGPDDFAVLIANTGEPLGLEQLLEAYRRGFIGRERLLEGIRQSRVRDEWAETAERLRYSPVPTADAVDAWLRGHISQETADQVAEQNGVMPDQVAILRANAGNPPGDVQVLEMWRRGIISESRAQEMLRFGRLRDEFVPEFMRLVDEPLPNADAVDAWLRGHLSQEATEAILKENGLLARDVPVALANAGNPLALEQLLEAYRRGFISEQRFTEGFRQSRYRDEWAGTALRLGFSPISTADAVDALVQGHINEETAREAAKANGLAPQWFTALWETAGEPLSRTELEQLYNRGLISAAVVEQGLRESRLKDKYVGAALELHVRLPEPREVVAALNDGVISAAQAETWLAEYGYQPAVVAMLIATGEAKSTGPHRELMSGEISKLYADRIIGEEQALGLLEQLHYTPWAAGMILKVADWTAQSKVLHSGIGAIRAHYLAGRVSEDVVKGDLNALGLPADTAATYLRVWDLDKLAHPKQLTEAQIVKAAKLGLFPMPADVPPDQQAAFQQAAGHARLVALGYDDTDADLLLAGA